MSPCGCSPINPGFLPVPTPPAFTPFPPATGTTSSNGGSSSSGTTPAVVACPDYLRAPVVRDAFTTVGIAQVGQFYSTCAYLWAVPGADLYISPLGSVNILGVSNDLITYRNNSIPAATVVNPGQLLTIGIPQAVGSSTESVQLDSVRGFLNNQDKFILGQANQVLRRNKVGSDFFWQPTTGMLFHPNPASASELPAKDISGNAFATTPFPSASTGGIAYYDLPNLPATNLLPDTFYAAIRVRLSVATIETTVLFSGKHNGVEFVALNSSLATNGVIIIPCTSSRVPIEYTKFAPKANSFARFFVMGYFF